MFRRDPIRCPDANFNISYLNGGTTNYDAEKRMTSVNGLADFTYDGLGRCVRRTVGSQTIIFLYDGWKPLLEFDQWGNHTAWNAYGAGPDEILWRYAGGVEIYYHTDPKGSVTFLLDGATNGVERYTYDVFGQPTVTDWNGGNARDSSWYAGNRFMFTGREYLSALSLYDYRNRMYRPSLGRFLQPDPIGFAAGDANFFRYCGGDPVNNTDPTGLYHEVSVSGNNVNIYLPIRYSGGTPSQIAAFNQGIQAGWSGQAGRYNVTMTVGNTYGNSVNIQPGTGAMLTRGTNLGIWRAGGLGIQGFTSGTSAANEAGRLLGFNETDGYDRVGRDRIVSKPGYEGNILGATPGGRPSEAQIQQIIDRAPGFWERLAVSILNFFGGVQPPAWKVAGYGSPEAHAAARLSNAMQYAASQAVPTWTPFFHGDFATTFSTANGQHHRADGSGGAYLVKPGQ